MPNCQASPNPRARGKDYEALKKAAAAPPDAASWSMQAYVYYLGASVAAKNLAVAAYNYTAGLMLGPIAYYEKGDVFLETLQKWNVSTRALILLTGQPARSTFLTSWSCC